jgi:hypothetical protein
MASSSYPWDSAKLFINGLEVRHGDPVVLIRGKENDFVVEAPQELAKQLRLGLVDAGKANLGAAPEFEAPVDPVGGKFSWRITSRDNVSSVVTLVLYSQEVDLPWEIECLVMSQNLSDEIDKVLVNGQPYPEGGWVISVRSEHDISLKYVVDSPVANYPLALGLELITDLKPGELILKNTGSHQWKLETTDKVGTFRMLLTGELMTSGIALEKGAVYSAPLIDEISKIEVDGENFTDFRQNGIRFRGVAQPQQLKIHMKPGSPLISGGLRILRGTGAADLPGAAPLLEPGYGFDVKAQNGVYLWKMTIGDQTSQSVTLDIRHVESGQKFNLRCRNWHLP